MGLVGFEGNLQDFVPQAVAIQTCYGHGGFFIVCHGHKAKAFALVGVEVANHFHIGNGAKRAEHLPEDPLIGILAQVVDEDAPARRSVARDIDTRKPTHVIYTHGGEPESLRLVVDGASEPSSWRVVQLGEQRHVFVLVGIGCELHCNGLGGTWGFMTIETGNCLFCLRPFVKPDKRNPSGQTCGLIHKDS